MRTLAVIVYLTAAFLPSWRASAATLDDLFATIEAVEPEGRGSTAARRARDEIAARGIPVLPQLLRAMNTQNPVAANWYRTIFEQLVRAELSRDMPNLPLNEFKQFVRQPANSGRARRLVLSIVDQHDSRFRGELIPTLLDDREFREDAVEATITAGDRARQSHDTPAAVRLYQTAFDHARLSTQVTRAADRLKTAGEPVSIVSHMGFLIDWHLLGPFDAPGKTGFEATFPPETKVDLTAEYAGKSGPIQWRRHRTSDRLGQLNLINSIAPVKEAVGYAYTEFDVPASREVELRCGADDNLTVWLNGAVVFRRLQWLNGTRLDRFRAPVTLRRGRNQMLVKICQGPQHKNPAVPNNWSMQLRLCNADGRGIAVKSALPAVQPRP